MATTRLLVLTAVVGFALLGAADDLLGDAGDRGFRGHVGALARGRPTTGILKATGGAALAVAVVGPAAGQAPLRLLGDAALVALAANLGNLLDRGPGRAGKASLVAFAVLAVGSGADRALAGLAVVAGAATALLIDDLREHLMLGDAGANVLGAALGLGAVLVFGAEIRTWILVVVAALNLSSEVVSFSRVIEGVAPLRALDRWGRRR
jgi:hypothetical protein